MQRGLEKIDAPEFAAGKTRKVKLPQTDVIAELVGNLTGQIDITGGTGAGDPFADGANRAVDEYRLRVGKQTLQAVKAQTLGVVASVVEAAEFDQTIPSDDAAGTSETVDAWHAIPQYMLRSLVPDSLAFPANAFSKTPILEVAFAPADAWFTNDADATDFSYAGNEEYELYMRPLQGELPGSPRAIAARFPPLLAAYEEYAVETSESAAKIRLENIELGDEIRLLVIETFSAGVDGKRYEFDSSVIDDFRLELDDDDIYGETSFAAAQQQNVRQYDTLTAKKTGVVIVDSAEDRQTGPGDLWRRTDPRSTPILHMSTSKQTGECLVRVTTFSVRR